MSEKNFGLGGLSEESFNESDDSIRGVDGVLDNEIVNLENSEKRDEQYVKTGSNVLEEEGDLNSRVSTDVPKDSDNKKFPIGKVVGGLLVATGLGSLGGSIANAERNNNKDLLNEKDSISSSLVDEDPTKMSEEEFTFLDSSIGSGLDEDGLEREAGDNLDSGGEKKEATLDVAEEIEGKDVLQEIRGIIYEINDQSLEDRVNSRLTVDAGLISFLSEEFPELGVPNLRFDFTSPEEDFLIKNRKVKSQIDGMNVKSLYEKFNLSGVDVDLESVLVRKGESGWNDEVLIYGGDIPADLLKEGDVISILKEGITFSQVFEGGGGDSDKGLAEVSLAVVVDKRMINGENILTVVYTDNEERLIKEIEIKEKDDIVKVLGGAVFMTRKDWGGEEPGKFDFVEHIDGSLLGFTPVFKEFSVEVGDLGTRLYTFHNIINSENEVLLTESLIPPGFKFSIKHILFVKYPDGSGVLFGLVKRNGGSSENLNSSIVLFQYRDPLSRNWINEHVVEFSHEFRADAGGGTKIENKWCQLENGYENRSLEFGWNNKGGLPFYTYSVSLVEEGSLIMEIFNYVQNFEY